MTNGNNFTIFIRLLTFLLGLGLISLLFFSYFREISAMNQDLGRHLLTGELILKTRQVPTINLFSYTYPEFPFINHHYLAEVVFSSLYKIGGFTLLLFLMSLFILLSCILLFRYTLLRTSLFASLCVSILYLPILVERSDLRPEIFSYILTILFTLILFRFRENRTKLIYLLPFFEFLWVNLHIYFPIGLLLIFLFFLDSLFTNHKKILNHQTITLLIIGLLSFCSTFLNPNGLEGALYPLSVFHNYGYSIEENQTFFLLESLGFVKPVYLLFKISVILLFSSLLLTLKRTRPIDWFLAFTFTLIAFAAVRNFPLFLLVTFLPFARSLTNFFPLVRKFFKTSSQSWIRLVFLFLALIFILIQTKERVNKYPVGASIPQEARQAVDFFETQNLQGPIFNNFDIGSYLSYRLYPKEKVFIDGRPEAYPSSFIQGIYIPIQENPQKFDQAAEKYHFNAIIFSHTDQTPWAKKFLSTVLKNPNWKTVYLNPMMIILLKNNSQNEPVLQKYAMEYEQLKMRELKEDKKSLYQAASFFQDVKLQRQTQTLYQRILQKDPRNCPVLFQLALLEKQQNFLTLQRINLYCR